MSVVLANLEIFEGCGVFLDSLYSDHGRDIILEDVSKKTEMS